MSGKDVSIAELYSARAPGGTTTRAVTEKMLPTLRVNSFFERIALNCCLPPALARRRSRNTGGDNPHRFGFAPWLGAYCGFAAKASSRRNVRHFIPDISIGDRSSIRVRKASAEAGEFIWPDGQAIDPENMLLSLLLPAAVKELFRELEREVEALCGQRHA